MICEEYRCLLIGLETLSLLNAEVHDYYRNRNLIRGIEIPVDNYELTKKSRLLLSVKGSSTTQMTFTNLNLQLLKISDTICTSAEAGLMPGWTIAGLETELLRREKNCTKHYTKLSRDDSQLAPHQGSHGILNCYINYLLHLLFLPDLQRYLDGEITPETKISQLKCMSFAKASLRSFNLLAENMQFKSYAWYIRGLGSYYAEQSAYTLTKGLEKLQGENQEKEVRSILKRTLGTFSTLSDRSIFSARGAFILEHYVCLGHPDAIT
jgi:hypothetical protein